MKRALLLGLLLGVLAACGGGGDDDGAASNTTVTTVTTTTSTTASTTTTSSATTTTDPDEPATATSTTAPTTTTAPASDSPAFTDPLEFFQSTEAACIEHSARVGNSPPEPQRFSGARVVDLVAFRVWLVEDGMGEEILVDLEGGVVYSVDGPDAPLPIMYSFGCPEDLYLGTLPA